MQPLSFFVKIIFGIVILSTGLTLLILTPWILEHVQTSILMLGPNSPIKNLWVQPPEVAATDIYFFNWTNPEDFKNLSIKPRLQQYGPYRYMQHTEKRNVMWNDNNTVTFNRMVYWNFDKTHANGNLSDPITTMNAIVLSLAHTVRHWSYFMKKGVSVLFATNSFEMHFTKTVQQFLNGFEDTVLDLGRLFPFIASDIPRLDKFGLLSIRNASETFDGVFNVANGRNGNFDILNWNYHNVTPHFNGSCAEVRGSTGELYSQPVTKNYVDIFMPDLCRSVRLDFEEEVLIDGIYGYKYIVGHHALDNGSMVPGNDCHCAGDCVPSGMINISSCLYGIPFFVSLPHMYGADPIYLEAIEGLHPEKSKHEAYVVIEPITGVLLKAVVRGQTNILVHPIEGISLCENVRKIYFPMAWAEQTVFLPHLQRMYLKLFLSSSYILIPVSGLLMLIGFYILVFVTFKSTFLTMYRRIMTGKASKPITPEEELLHQ